MEGRGRRQELGRLGRGRREGLSSLPSELWSPNDPPEMSHFGLWKPGLRSLVLTDRGVQGAPRRGWDLGGRQEAICQQHSQELG